ncbi:MAG: hypothetical protein RI994_935, partial [Pseudomonadota bacterium]
MEVCPVPMEVAAVTSDTLVELVFGKEVQELGEELGVTPAQIRKDLSYFGRFGKQGRGYSVARLAEE